MSDYYHEHSKEFIDNTINCDMSEQYRFFEKHLRGKGKILDIGFGSGRDSLYFKSKGYDVYSIDPESTFVESAKKMGLQNVFQMKAEEINFENEFDGIWACASLLHIPSKDLNSVFKKCAKALKPKGIFYASFKYGSFEGVRNDRFYTDLNENAAKTLLNGTGLFIIDLCITKDVRDDHDEEWLNLILEKR